MVPAAPSVPSTEIFIPVPEHAEIEAGVAAGEVWVACGSPWVPRVAGFPCRANATVVTARAPRAISTARAAGHPFVRRFFIGVLLVWCRGMKARGGTFVYRGAGGPRGGGPPRIRYITGNVSKTVMSAPPSRTGHPLASFVA